MLRIVDGNRVEPLDVASYFAGGIETEEQLEAALEGLRERVSGAHRSRQESPHPVARWTRTPGTRSSVRPRAPARSSSEKSPSSSRASTTSASTGRSLLSRERISTRLSGSRARSSSPPSTTTRPSVGHAAEAVGDYLREAAFTTLNRFVALKMLEARELVQECVSRGDQSSGFREFGGLAPGLVQLPDQGYRLYLESIFDEIGQEVGHPLRPARSVEPDLAAPAGAHRPARDPQRTAAGDRLGRRRDDRVGLPVLQQRGRAEADARRERRHRATAASSPCATSSSRRAMSSDSSSTTRSLARGGRCGAATPELAEICEFLVLDNADELVARRRRIRATSGSSTPRAAPATSFSTRSISSRPSTKRPGTTTRRRRHPRPARRCSEDYARSRTSCATPCRR